MGAGAILVEGGSPYRQVALHFDKAEASWDVPRHHFFVGRLIRPVDTKSENLSRPPAFGNRPAGHGPARDIEHADAAGLGFFENGAQVLPARTKELIDVTVDDPVCAVLIPGGCRKHVTRRVVIYVAV